MRNKFYSEKEIEFLKENIDKFGASICADKLDRTERSVINACYKRIGHCCFVCHVSEEEINNLSFEYKFEPLSIDFSKTEHPKELAYFLGYFWADGYIRKGDNLVMDIVKEDADDIEHILMKLVKFAIYERNRPNKKPQKSFFYHDYEKNIANKLVELGKYSYSIESHEKIIKYIPKEYINYFLRGLFDGDGCLYVSKEDSKHHCTQLYISGRYGQDWNYLVSFIKEKYDLNFKPNLRTYKEYKSSVIRATDKAKIVNFLREIYKEDDGVYLPRKYKKIKELTSKN